MKFTLHHWQQVAVDHACSFLESATPDMRQGYSAPTGSGKSVVMLAVQARCPDAWIITPKDEIIVGMLQKLGLSEEEAYRAEPFDYRISTPVRLRNAIMAGRIEAPGKLIFDEAHHHSAETWQQLSLLSGLAPSVAYTATFYRGSPRGTRELLEHWGEVIPLLTYQEACAEGYIVNPSFETVPLVDDDVVDITGGEFNVTSLESATVDRLGDAADHMRRYYRGTADGWDMPTMVALPNTGTLVRMHQEMLKRGLPAAYVRADTSKEERWAIFEACEKGILALLHINVVSEGVDLKVRRLVDLAPTMSPVRWVQQLGRITRPWDRRPEYVCCNRNIMRHAYALDGAVSLPELVQSEQSFPPTERAHSRALGLEAIGRFKPTQVKLSSGLTCHMYTLSVPIESNVIDYCCIVHPGRDPHWFSKVQEKKADGTRDWGTWRETTPPTDLRGFGSVAPNNVTPKQKAWWDRSAAGFGLDPNQELTRKNFPILPVLKDTGVRL